MVPTLEMGLFSQQGMDHSCVSHGQLFIPGFILLKEPYSCITGAINYNKEDLEIMSSITQYDDHKSNDVQLFILECDKFDRRGEMGNKERWYCGLCGNEYNIWSSTKSLMHLTTAIGHKISRCRGEILPKYQCHFKALKKSLRNQSLPNTDMLQTLDYSCAEARSKYFLLGNRRKVYGTSFDESNWVGYPIEVNIEGESHESFDVSGEISTFSLQTRELLWGDTG